jgi:hypothetical protein
LPKELGLTLNAKYISSRFKSASKNSPQSCSQNFSPTEL